MVFDEQALKSEIEKTWGENGAHADVYRDLLKRESDYKLMLKVLGNGWCVWWQDDKWIWHGTNGSIFMEITATQSDIPEINDEFREKLIKRYGE